MLSRHPVALSNDILTPAQALILATEIHDAVLEGKKIDDIHIERLCCYIIKTVGDAAGAA